MDNLDDMRNTSYSIVSYRYQLLPNTDLDHLQQVEYIYNYLLSYYQWGMTSMHIFLAILVWFGL